MASAIHPLLLLLLFSFVAGIQPDSDAGTLVSDLISLRSRSISGVIRFDDHSLRRFFSSSTPRPYSLVIFFDAEHLHSNPDLHLSELRSEFALVSNSFLIHHENQKTSDKLFFAFMEFKESQSSFAQFGVNALPHVRIVEPSCKNLKDSIPMDQILFSRLAEGIADFVNSKTKISVGPITRPPPISRAQIMILFALVLISAPFLIKRILQGDTMLHDPKLWMFGAVFVYFMSVSGFMHNVIRKMPMFITDRNDPSKLVFFYKGSGMQLGAEGFAVGFLYTVVGVLVAAVVGGLVKVRNVNLQRLGMMVAMLVSFWAVREVVKLDNWKTGYGIHGYWPSSWQ